ncbi:protein NinF, partial [Escherichia coli]
KWITFHPSLTAHVCEACCAELMSDLNSSMYEEEDDG